MDGTTAELGLTGFHSNNPADQTSVQKPNRQLTLGLVAFVVTIAIGFAGYRLAGWSALDSIYMVIITIFGVGYGEVHPVDGSLQVFTIVFIIAGCTSLIYTVGAFINWLTEGQIQEYFGRIKMEKEISNLEKHVVICGFGRVGQMLATQLHEAGRSFVIIDKDPRQIEVINDCGFLYIEGEATEEIILQKARIEKASVIATVLPNDAANVFIVLSCRSLNPRLTIIARANQNSTEAKLKQAGADKVVMPAVIGAQRIAHIVLKPNAREILEQDLRDNAFIDGLADIGLEIDEIPIAENDPMVNHTLEDLETEGRSAFIVVAVRHQDGQTLLKPPLDYVLKPGDHLIVMSHIGVVPKFVRTRLTQSQLRYRGA